MEEKIYKIILADGTTIDNLKLNGNNFISQNVIDESVFKGNCSPVIINDGETDEKHDNMECIQITQMEDECWFILRDISNEELMQKAFMSGVSLMAAKTLSDEEALTVVEIFPEWTSDSKNYQVDDRVKHEGTLYKCLQNHTSQMAWTPDATPSLWVRMDDPAVEWPAWVQPTGSTDAYAKGAKVEHDGKHWISDADANVWEPGVSGWTEQIEQ